MNRLNASDTEQHQQILLLLPWYVNQSLAEIERKQVENHLRVCLLCKRELLALRNLSAAVRDAADLEVAAEASFSRFRSNLHFKQPIRHEKPNNKFSRFWRATVRHSSRRPLQFLAIAASLLVVMMPLMVSFYGSTQSPDYFTLASARPEHAAGVKLRVVFAASVTDSEIQHVLEQIDGQRLEGPSAAGAYLIALNSSHGNVDIDSVLASLRQRSDIKLAERVLHE